MTVACTNCKVRTNLRYNANSMSNILRGPTTNSPTFRVLLEFDEPELAGRS